MSKRLLCVYQHAPTPGAPGIYRHRILLAELARRGWQVDLVSTPINYMTGATDPRYVGRRYVREEIDGIVHHWVWASGSIHASKRRRAANYATFSASTALRAATLPRPDVVLVSSPPLSVAALGPVLGRRFRRPWVLEIRDIWPESAVSVGWLDQESSLYRTLEKTAKRLTARAAAVIVPTPGLVGPVLAHGARRIVVVPGVTQDSPPDPARRNAIRASLGVDQSACVFLYLGSIGVANGLDVLLEAAPLLPPEAIVVLVGDGSARAAIDQRLARGDLPAVRLMGAVPKQQVPDWLAASDVCLHLLRRDAVFESALPSKVLEYFGAHRPFVTNVPGLPARLARASGGGVTGDDASSLAAELTRWASMAPEERLRAGERSFAYGRERFSLEAVVDSLEDALDSLTSSDRGGAAPTSRVPSRPDR